jgi:hypothetical protein
MVGETMVPAFCDRGLNQGHQVFLLEAKRGIAAIL